MKLSYLFTLIFFFTSSLIFSQDIEQLRRQAKAAGLSDEQINAAIFQQTQTQIIDQAQVSRDEGKVDVDNVFINQLISSPKSKKFGVDIFKSKPGGFSPNDYGPVPDDYVIGPGDKLEISMWGQVEIYHSTEVDRAGMIQIPNVGLISVSGLTLKNAQEVIKVRMSASYSGLKTGHQKLSVTLSFIRSMRIFVGGFVRQPGAYRLSAISNPISVIYAVGGISEQADLRNIKLIKSDGTIHVIDLYQYLYGLKNIESIKLDNNDILFIPAESNSVFIYGEVNQPAIYDLKENETFSDLLNYAGGITPLAWMNNVQVNRIVPGKGIKKISFDYTQLSPEIQKIQLMPGDTVYIPRTTKIPFETITVLGSVRQSGTFMYNSTWKIKDYLEASGGVREWTYFEMGQMITQNEDSSFSIKNFNVTRALNGITSDNLVVPDRSTITVKNKWRLTEREFVEVKGYVNNPSRFSYHNSMTIADALFLANGFQAEAFVGRIEVSRMNYGSEFIDDRKIAAIIEINNEFPLNGDNKALQFNLEPFDHIYIRKDPTFTPQRTVTILGEIKYPGNYPLQSKDEKIYDVLSRSGGLLSTAYIDGITLKRFARNEGYLPIKFNEVLKNKNSLDNIVMFHGDTIYVPEVVNTIKVIGSVFQQSTVLYKSGKDFNYYIEQAGGITPLADKPRIHIIQPNKTVFVPDNYWFFTQPEILPGSVVIVPSKEKIDEIDWKTWVQLSTTTMTSIITILLLIRQLNN